MFAPTAQPGGSAARFTATPRGGCIRLQVAGEVDLLNREQFHGALAALASDGITTVHLEMSQLQFAGLACTRELVAFALSHPWLRIILHDPPDSLRRIMILLGLPGPAVNIHIKPGRQKREYWADGPVGDPLQRAAGTLGGHQRPLR